MGEVIRKDAGVDDIIADGNATLTKAVARGGDWQASAQARLGPPLAMCAAIDARLTAANAGAAPALAALGAANDVADNLLGRVADDVWNAIGRPASDVAYDLIFPGGFAYYADGDVNEQPDRMDLLAELLASGIHPRLPPGLAATLAAEVAASSVTLRAHVDTARPLRARAALASRMRTAVGRATQIALVGLKRSWKADGKSEAEIHAVIPDRPKAKKALASTPPAPPVPPVTPPR